MKASFCLAVIGLLTLAACKKSASPVSTPASDNWQLLKKFSSIGSTYHISTPAADSSVILSLDSNGSYVSKLNNKVVSQGSYSITTDTSYYNTQVLQLNNFRTTGIFSLFLVEEIGSNGQVLSSFDGLFMNIHADTLTLAGALTPGGVISYVFIKK